MKVCLRQARANSKTVASRLDLAKLVAIAGREVARAKTMVFGVGRRPCLVMNFQRLVSVNHPAGAVGQ